MNDIVEWACEIKKVETDVWKWSTINHSNKYVDIVKVKKGLWTLSKVYKSEPSKVQPDKDMAIQVIVAKFDWSYTEKEFRRLTKIRNALPLIHGKRPASGSVLESEDAKMSDIDNLINILGTLVDKHKELLDTYGE